MRIVNLGSISGVLIVASLMVTGQPAPAAGKTPATIVSPKRDEVVEPVHEFVGRVSIPGQPMVLIRPDVPGGEWYPQPTPEVSDRGVLKAKLRFGNDKTAKGTKFQVAIVVLTTDEDAELFKGKESLALVPETIAHSEVISVVLGKATSKKPAPETTPLAGLITYPEPEAKVKTVTEVSGKMTSEGWPVVIVRSNDPNDHWWIQGTAKFGEEGTFTSSARFGNDKTPNGKSFSVAFLTFPSAKAAEAYATGISLESLPIGISMSKEVSVILERPESK